MTDCERQKVPTRLKEVPFTQVVINDDFWSPRLKAQRERTLPACLQKCEETGRIANFAKAAKLEPGDFVGIYFDDSDVYKVLEGVAYSLLNQPDPEMEERADKIIDLIAAAQQEDGYVFCYYILSEPDRKWTDMEKHEMYCAGHLIEAGLAYKRATGKPKLLEVGRRMIDHIDSVFGPAKRHWVAGHQEIELALVKLYRETNERRYLDLARWLLEERGRGHGRGRIWEDSRWGPEYCQDDVPVHAMKEAKGHAVRAMYMYSAMADIIAETGDQDYLDALHRMWDVIVSRNMYITGGIGPSADNEGFTRDYDLPNDTAYCETCASVGMIYWCHRMGMLEGDARYVDVLERAMYNSAIAGVSLSGDRFFYENPLYSDGTHHRQEWYKCACCPTQVARFIPSIGSNIYATSPGAVWINLYVAGKVRIDSGGAACELVQETRYPYDGKVRIRLETKPSGVQSINLRIPGWCRAFELKINGSSIEFLALEKGYVKVNREWRSGDVIELRLDMPVVRVHSSPRVKNNEGRVSLQRGPLVYCVEEMDCEVPFEKVKVGSETVFAIDEKASLFEIQNPPSSPCHKCGTGTEQSVPLLVALDRNGERLFSAIPYCFWDNREAGRMAVWLAEQQDESCLYVQG